MAAHNLLALLDDITAVLDDVAVLSKVAAKKASGVLGDDLALNAEKVTGVRAERELPVVWTVAKGSFINKCILIPAALAISAIMPKLVIILLILGGAYLCFEGAEKLLHALLHAKDEKSHQQEHIERLAQTTSDADLVALEKDKIKGAIRTDFILSAEIIVITLGLVQSASFVVQLSVLIAIGLGMTVGVYGLVAGIVKLDDLGMYWKRSTKPLLQKLGGAILVFAPWLMRFLSFVGTAAMFLVGGGILVHNQKWIHHGLEKLEHVLHVSHGGWQASILEMFYNGVVGLLLGALLVLAFTVFKKLFGKKNNA